MKVKALLASLGLLVLVGCGSEEEKQREHERQMACIEATGDRYCRTDRDDYDRPQVVNIEIEYEYENVHYEPTRPGSYTNYYGNPQHGYWDEDGDYQFYDPYSHEASSTNSFLLGAGLGGLVGYQMSKSKWQKNNPKGWVSKSRNVDRIIDKNGKTITKAEADRRAAQSRKDKAKHAQKLKDKRVAQQKAKQAKTNKEKAAKKPTTLQQAELKDKMKQNQKARAEKKANGTNTNKFAKQKQIEQKAKTSTPAKPKAKTSAPKPRQVSKPKAKPYKAPKAKPRKVSKPKTTRRK